MTSLARMISAMLILAVCLPFLGSDALGQNITSVESIQAVLEDESERQTMTEDEWKDFGTRLTEALESDNRGVQTSALRLAAYHGDRLQMGRRAAISAVKFYRDDPDPYVRKLAVVAIARINHPWGIDFLTRSLDFEKEEGVEATMQRTLKERAVIQDQ